MHVGSWAGRAGRLAAECRSPTLSALIITLDAVEIVSARLDAPESDGALSAKLSAAERRRAARYRFERDRRRYIVARARLRELLGERLQAPPESIELAYGAQGKPRLAGRFARSGWRFNLARRGELAVYGFSRRGELGVDVEALAPVPEATGIAARFFSSGENRTLQALPAAQGSLGFFNCWTRKEAFVKALGEGLFMPLDAFDVSLAPGEPPAVLRIADTPGDGGWRLHSFSPCPGFVGAAAIHRG